MPSANFQLFLGANRIARLKSALKHERKRSLSNDSFFVITSIILLLSYSAVMLQDSLLSNSSVVLISCICAVGFVAWYRLSDRGPLLGRMGDVHTAFALGVIPALIVVLFFREAFLIPLESGRGGEGDVASGFELVMMLVGVSIFAGLSEEVVFRGLLLSALRRVWSNNGQRDWLAIGVSSLLFGAFHAVIWGPAVGAALISVGFGLGAGYLASGERLGTVIIYHSVFDFLSLATAFLLLNI
jgi:membrane protease YdiL (CAAX protease family)